MRNSKTHQAYGDHKMIQCRVHQSCVINQFAQRAGSDLVFSHFY